MIDSSSGIRFSVLEALGRHFRRYDCIQIVSVAFLITVGLVFIYSTGQQAGGAAAAGVWKKQLQWVFVGVCVWLALTHFDYRKITPFIIPFYCICLIALIVVLFTGVTINGAKRWLSIGSSLRLQPSEFTKFSVVLLLAQYFAWRKFDANNFTHLAGAAAVIMLPFLLILIEPDLGSAMVLIPVGAVLIIAAGLNWKKFIFFTAAVAICLTCGIVNENYRFYPLLKEYQRERILVFLDPNRDIAHRGYNQFQAKLAVGSGGFAGKGIGKGTQNTLRFLPRSVANNDFIFSVIAEETGFVGSALLLFGFALLVFSALRTAWAAKDSFGRYIALGIAVIFFVHVFVNIGMSIGVTPVTGVPLPFVSYGGSFMLFCLACLGLLQSIYIHREED